MPIPKYSSNNLMYFYVVNFLLLFSFFFEKSSTKNSKFLQMATLQKDTTYLLSSFCIQFKSSIGVSVYQF